MSNITSHYKYSFIYTAAFTLPLVHDISVAMWSQTLDKHKNGLT